MIQIIAGEKGKGKTKVILAKVNEEVKAVKGNIVYLDKSNKHMYELSNKIRLINVRDYLIEDHSEFLGFICGLISQDHDIEKVYLDSFLKLACIDKSGLDAVLTKLEEISEKFNVDFIISVCLNANEIPKQYQDNIHIIL